MVNEKNNELIKPFLTSDLSQNDTNTQTKMNLPNTN